MAQMKRRKSNNDTNNYNIKNNEKEVNTSEKELIVDGRKVGTTTQKFAQMFSFSELENILTQNVGKSVQKTYTSYTKDRLITYIQSPAANIDNIRDVSQYLYRISMNYKKIIDYYALMPLFSYNVTYNTPDWSKAPKVKDFLSSYQEICKRLDNMGLKSMCSQAIATCLRDGIYVGFTYDNEDGFFINALDPKYCKISGLTDKNTYIVKFNAAYFDSGNNKEFLYGVNEDGEGTWDSIFVEGYETYKNDGRDFQWFELPPERTISIICGDDPTVPLPYFVSIFQELLDLMDYKDLIRSKTELENYVLLLSKIPLIDGSESVDDFAVSLDLVKLTQQMIDSVAPSLVATAFSPCEVEPIFFNNKNQVEDTNVYAQALTNLFSSIGVSEMIFNSDKGGSVGLKHSLQVDMTFPFELLARLEANIQRYIKLNISDEFIFEFHRITEFNKDEYINSKKEAATLGGSAMDYLTATGDSPFKAYNKLLMENALDIKSMMIPLKTSYTQTTDSGISGGQNKSDDELTEEGLKTRDGDKNGTENA